MADYPNTATLTDLDTATPAGTEVASKIDDAIRQIKYFLTQYLAVAHNADGTAKASSTSLASIANDLITYAKIQNVSATDRVLGRQTAGAGDIEEITCTAAGRALLDDADATAQRATLGLGAVALLASVGTANIDALAITSALLAANAVTSAKITDANVTTAKIADQNVTTAKVASTGSDAAPKLIVQRTGGCADATVGGVLTAIYNAGVLEFSFAGTTVPSSGADNAALAYARLEEQRAVNTTAGATTGAGTWDNRTGWVENDPAAMVSVSAEQITFAKAGVYWVKISVPCSGAVGFHRCRLYNNTTSAQIKVGTTEQCAAGVTTRSELWEVITIATDNTVLKVQTQCTTAQATGLGAPANLAGEAEIYSIMEIVKL